MDFFAGVLLGALGVLPFVHTNLILQAAKPFIGSSALASFVAAVSFSHLVFETLPALFLFIPTQNLAASVLPFQRMALQGRGAEALNKIVAATLLALAFAVALLPVQAIVLPALKQIAGESSKWGLVLVVFLFFWSISGWRNKLVSLSIFLLAGMLGVVALTGPLVQEPLFPLLTGLFAVPAILLARGDAVEKIGDSGETAGANLKLVLLGVAVGSVSSLLPGMTVAVLLAVCLMMVGEGDGAYLFLAPSVAASKTLYDLTSGLTTGRARSMGGAMLSGASAGTETLAVIGISALAAAALTSAIVLVVYRKAFSALRETDLDGFRKALLAALALLVFALGGVAGVLLATAAACVGALPMLCAQRRSLAVGALIIPSLSHFFFPDLA